MTAPPGAPLATLSRIVGTRPAPEPGERCEMCAAPIGQRHQHVVNLQTRALMCNCRPCYLLFSDQQAALRYRAVPDRYLSFPGFRLDPAQWHALQIPVGLVFLFTNSALERTVAFYPGPAGATESELPLAAWAEIVEANPQLRVLVPDVEALLIRAPGGPGSATTPGSATAPGSTTAPGSAGSPAAAGFDCHLVPVDVCYELVGQLRRNWRGFDGGQQARALIAELFTAIAARSRPAPEPTP